MLCAPLSQLCVLKGASSVSRWAGVVVLVVSAVLTALTVALPVEVDTHEQLEAVPLGYPFPFFVQNLSRYTPLSFPQYFRMGSPWEDPLVAWLWPNFFASYGIIAVLAFGVYRLAKRLFPAFQRK